MAEEGIADMSGRLGVGGSNPLAPTIFPLEQTPVDRGRDSERRAVVVDQRISRSVPDRESLGP